MRPYVCGAEYLKAGAVGAAATMARVACPPRPFWTGCSFNDGARRERGRAHGRGAWVERVHTRTRPVKCAKRTRCLPRAAAENEAAGSVVFDYKDDVDQKWAYMETRSHSRYTHAHHSRAVPRTTSSRDGSARV
jgi:hypothetical protein